MGLLECSNRRSISRGFGYFESGHVYDLQLIDELVYTSNVKGSNNNLYQVKIDLLHPRKSSCTCPYTSGNRKICKHMIATLFLADPQAASDFKNKLEAERLEYERYETEYNERYMSMRKDVVQYVESLTIDKLKTMLINYMMEASEASLRQGMYEDYDEYEDDIW